MIILALTVARIAGIAAFFRAAKKKAGRRFPDSPPQTVLNWDFQPSDATRLDSREIFRAAVFLWITPRATPRIISG